MAGTKIYIATSRIWDHYCRNMNHLTDNEDMVAENKETGMSLCITREAFLPQLVLYTKGDRPIIWRPVRNSEECNTAAVYLITRYLVDNEVPESPKVLHLPAQKVDEDDAEIEDVPINVEDKPVEQEDDISKDEDEEEQRILDTIYEREDELSNAVGDMLAVVLVENDCSAVTEAYGQEFINAVVDHLLQWLYDEQGVSVYRPTLDTDPKTGEEVLMEFPYGWGEDSEDESM